jgi:hypothetical protein
MHAIYQKCDNFSLLRKRGDIHSRKSVGRSMIDPIIYLFHSADAVGAGIGRDDPGPGWGCSGPTSFLGGAQSSAHGETGFGSNAGKPKRNGHRGFSAQFTLQIQFFTADLFNLGEGSCLQAL